MMERLTNENHKEMGLVAYTGEKNPYNVPLTIGELAGFITSDYSPREILEEVFARLAAYEDTGLTPKEIMSLIATPNPPPPPEELREIVEQLEFCGYQCEGGPLEMNKAFILLRNLAYRNKPSE